MTNLTHNCFILQYVYYSPLHVSSIICSSSGGQILLIQHLVFSISVSGRPVHRFREKWFPLNLSPSGAQVERELVPSQPVHLTATY